MVRKVRKIDKYSEFQPSINLDLLCILINKITFIQNLDQKFMFLNDFVLSLKFVTAIEIRNFSEFYISL